jgi:peptidoglycan/LPS O-acetylase OafA/YrhL
MLRGGAPVFFRKRARRILPPYYLSLGCSLLLIRLLIGHKTGTHWDISLPVTWKGVVAHLFLVQDIYGAPQINHVFWSIAVEWQIYFLFPLLVALRTRINGLRTTVGMLVLSVVFFYLTQRTPLNGMNFPYFGLFALGMLAAEIAYSTEESWTVRRAQMPWAAILAVTLLIAAGMDMVHRRWVADYFAGSATLALLILAARSDNNPARRFLSWRPLVALGLFAYSIYLIHAPLIQVVWQYLLHPLHLGDRATFALLACPGCPLILGAAYLFYLTCERPFLNRARSS